MAISKPKAMTANAFERFIARPENASRLWELIDGEAVEKMPTQLHGYIAARIAAALLNYLEQHPLGWPVVEARHKMPTDDENSRVPDVAFISRERGPLVEQGAAPYMPDLAVEIKSPDDDWYEMRKKADYYLANGSKLVWLVYTEKRLVMVLTANSEDILKEDDTLAGGDLLPSFTLPVKAIFPA
jgi:Uma2 family endonuclease